MSTCQEGWTDALKVGGLIGLSVLIVVLKLETDF